MPFDMQGLYVITDSQLIEREKFTETVEKALKGGANLLQLREKDTTRDEIINLGIELLVLTKQYGVPLIINDSPEIALEIGADGVHLGEHDMDVESARGIVGEDSIIGVSCYGELDRGAEAYSKGADYLAFGTPYFTPTKPERVPTSLEVLKTARRKFPDIPIFAIGGIDKTNAPTILETGVDGIAVITSVFGAPDPELAAKELSSVFQSG